MSTDGRRRERTHYEVLGVARTANADEIRRAYRAAARDAHPDRHGEASAARMAEVNEAWRVLGDAGRRRQYDLGFADGAPSSSSSSGSSTAPSASPSPAGARPAPMPTGDLSRFPWRFFAVIGVLAIVVVGANSILSDPPPPAPVDNMLLQGECVDVDEARLELTEVRCVGPHEGTVQTVVNFDAACPTGTEQYREPQGRGWACVARAAG